MKNNILISLCMIVKNEELTLARCLNSVKDFVDEIIIVDTGSTDETKNIAKQFTDKIYDFKWCDDFGKARNFSFSKARGKYLMWLDADDVIDKKDLKKLIKLKPLLSGEVDFYMFKYNIAFDECDKPTFTYYRERIIKNNINAKWKGFIHEAIAPFGEIKYLDISVQHKKIVMGDPKRNLKIYEQKLNSGYMFNARDLYYYSRELYYNGFYEKAILNLDKLLTRDDVWLEDRLGAIEIKARCETALRMFDKSINTLLTSFIYEIPRANVLCLIGDNFMYKNCHQTSIYWYKLAIRCHQDCKYNYFQNVDFYNFYPYLQLVVCYFKIGDVKKSFEYNTKALKIKPKNKIALDNDKFFKNYFKITKN